MHSNDMACFKGLESHLRSLYQNSFVHVESLKRVEWHFIDSSFQEFFDSEAVTSSDHLNPILQENFKDYMGCEPETYRSNLLKYLEILAKCIDKRVFRYYELRMKEREIKKIKETKKLLNEAIPHKHDIEKSFKLQSNNIHINPVQAVDASLVVTESSEIESENNSSENALSKSVNEIPMQMQEEKVDIDTKDADIRLVNDEEPMAELQLTIVYDVLANEQ
ncbi:hypothetical protein Tco_1251893 [Tanacetum coccineum]